MKSPAAFQYFENNWQFYDLNLVLKNKSNAKYREKSYVLKLIEIDTYKAVKYILYKCKKDQAAKEVIKLCIKELNSEM